MQSLKRLVRACVFAYGTNHPKTIEAQVSAKPKPLGSEGMDNANKEYG